ncbi:hypothetical protein HY486_03640 [Candidatus Woesearchaeota archaeon]|nr:hypothetical protein [Candidatus Woesearchaeota archaeon]
MFVRVKEISNKEYAYLVSNEWTKYGSRQRVAKYLGRVIRLAKVEEYPYPELKDPRQAIKDLIKRELLNYGFVEKGEVFVNGDLIVEKDFSVKEGSKNVVLALNEGFLTKDTIDLALNYSPEETHDKSAKKLASVCLEAGIKLSDSAFLRLFELHNKEEKPERIYY